MKTIHTQNHNNKLNSDVFLHIDLAPAGPLAASKLPIKVMVKEIVTGSFSALEQLSQTQTKSIEFEAEVIDLQRLHLSEIGSVVTYISNGCDRQQFIEQQVLKDGPLDVNYAIYIIKKIK